MDISQSDRLSQLPQEVLTLVAQNVSGQQNLKSLCRVSKMLHKIATPFLYETVVVNCSEGFNPRLSALNKFSRKSRPLEYGSGLKHVRELAVRSEFRDHLRSRCYHNRPLDLELRHRQKTTSADASSGSSQDVDNGDAGLESDIEDADSGYYLDDEEPDDHDEDFLLFCQQLRDHGLRSFSWDLGTCVPLNILGPRGYLSVHQNSLECLSLITDGSCPYAMDGMNPLDLSAFTNLHEFSWIGQQSREDFEALTECLQNNAVHLKVLRLDIVDWERADDFWFMDESGFLADGSRSSNFFATDIMGLQQDTTGLQFLSLQILSLSALSFKSAVNDLSSAFRLTELRQLRLWKCPGAMDLMDAIVGSQQILHLVSLEIVVGLEGMGDLEETTPSRFLQTFSGLRDLYISLPILEWSAIADAIMNHLSTLKRLVLHARSLDRVEDSRWFEEEEDCGIEWGTEMSHLFETAVCDVVGVGNPPSFMQECLEPIASTMNCRMLHLRTSGDDLERTSKPFYVTREELHTFAEWAFGPDGMQELDVIAYGDFSLPELYEDDNALLCRADTADGSSSFQTLESSSGALWEWVQSHMDALGSCAYRSIISTA